MGKVPGLSGANWGGLGGRRLPASSGKDVWLHVKGERGDGGELGGGRKKEVISRSVPNLPLLEELATDLCANEILPWEIV